jgi:pyrroline-5-carboxylate reductase
MNEKIAIIGCGNLGLSIAQGLIKKGMGKNLVVTRRNIQLLKPLEKDGVTVTTDNNYAVTNSKIILLALKPFKIAQVLDELNPLLTSEHIVISSATGVPLKVIEAHSGACKQTFRVMPNVAAAVAESASCVCKSATATDASLQIVKTFFDLTGKTVIINEELMESATVLAGCGTAFVLRFIRAMVQAGIQIGFSSQTATEIANQTVKGAAEILLQTGNHPEAEIDKVTTPKGITITGLNEMEHQGFSSALIKGMLTAYKKIEESTKN